MLGAFGACASGVGAGMEDAVLVCEVLGFVAFSEESLVFVMPLEALLSTFMALHYRVRTFDPSQRVRAVRG